VVSSQMALRLRTFVKCSPFLDQRWASHASSSSKRSCAAALASDIAGLQWQQAPLFQAEPIKSYASISRHSFVQKTYLR
jgi:hypothetical protein